MTMKSRRALAGTAAVLGLAVLVYFMARTPRAESPATPVDEQQAPEVDLVGAGLVSPTEDPPAGVAQRSPEPEEPPGGVLSAPGTSVLRVILEGIPSEDARRARVTLTGLDERNEWPAELRSSWPCQGSTSEFDLEPFFASVAARDGDLRVDRLEVEVEHPLFLVQWIRISLSSGLERTDGRTVFEVRVPLAGAVYWPETTLSVRDARTRAHLEDVELHCVPAATMGHWRRPAPRMPYHFLDAGLSSPIALLGGYWGADPEHQVGGVALGSPADEPPQLVALGGVTVGRGLLVYARAPGYGWGRIVLDLSTGAERELLLEPGAALNVQLGNVQLERYAALETEATLCVYRHGGGSLSPVWLQRLDETLEAEGLRLEGLEPSDYRVAVELRGWSKEKRPMLALEEISLVADESRELVLALADPPARPARATLGGVVAFPAFGGEEEVRILLYRSDDYDWVGARARYRPSADVELSLTGLERVGGTLPTWSFRLEDLPVGLYHVHLQPLLKGWMVELPAGGREDVELVIPELAEVLVETVDAATGERIPIDELYYNHGEVLPGQVMKDRVRAVTEAPGRFRFWTAPGTGSIWPYDIPSELGYGGRSLDLELVAGLQSVRLELEPVYAMRFEFRDRGTALPGSAQVGVNVSGDIRAVGHQGRVTHNGLQRDMRVEVSAPGVYEISFASVDTERYHPVPPRRVEVRAGETTEVIVELQRK